MAAAALAYFGAGVLIHHGQVVHGPIALFWLPAAIGLAVLLRGGRDFLPALWLAALVTARYFGLTWPAAAGIATGSIGAQLVTVLLLRRCGFSCRFARERDIVCYGLAAALGLLASAIIGTEVLLLTGWINGGSGFPWVSLRSWWLGDWMAAMVFGPLLLTADRENLRQAPTQVWRHRYWLTMLLLAMIALSPMVVGGQAHSLPWVFGPVLLMCAATMRFGRPAVIIGVPLFATFLIVVSLFGQGGGETGEMLGRSLLQDWMLVGGVSAIGWLLATLLLSRDREANQRRRAEDTLQQRQRMLRAVLDHAPIGIWMQDATGRLQFVNRAFCDALGIPEEKFLAVPHYRELYPPDIAHSCMASDAQALAQNEPHVSREKLTFTDGQVHEVEIVKSRLLDEQGRVAGLIGISLDMTERRRTEESLQLQSRALDSAANAILITDRQGRIEWTNQAFTRLTGYSREEAIGRRPGDLLGSGRHDAEFFRNMWGEIMAGRTWRGQMYNRRRDGALYTEEMTITPIRDAAGAVQRFIAIKEDVSALVAAREALQHSEERYRQLFEGNPVPMWVMDVETLMFLALNPAALQQYGYTREEMLRMTIRDIRPPEEQARLHDYFRQRTPSYTGPAGEWRHQRKDGRIFPVEVQSSPIAFMGRNARLVIAVDVTEKRKLQEQVMRTQRMESIGLLAAGIAHDLNNILTPMRMVGPMLRAQIRNPEDQRILSLVDHSAERGAALVRQILAFAHGTGSERGPVQLKEVVRDVALFVSETFPKEMQFRQHVPSSLWPVSANPTQIHQVLLNLCVNARDAMGQGGTLRLSATNERLTLETASLIPGGRVGPFVCLEVADTGTGIHPSVLPHIWEPFFTTKSPGKGTGLGLSTVRGIINSHEGFCAVESTQGEGTTFRIYLPALDEPVDGSVEAEGPSRRGHDELVLVVDDESFVRDAVRDALLKHGYRIVTAHDGIEALRLLELHRHELRLVVTDMRMPRMGGDRLIAIIRETYPEMKIFAMSGDTDSPQLGNGTGPHAFITKPFDLGRFRNTVDELLNEVETKSRNA